MYARYRLRGGRSETSPALRAASSIRANPFDAGAMDWPTADESEVAMPHGQKEFCKFGNPVVVIADHRRHLGWQRVPVELNYWNPLAEDSHRIDGHVDDAVDAPLARTLVRRQVGCAWDSSTRVTSLFSAPNWQRHATLCVTRAVANARGSYRARCWSRGLGMTMSSSPTRRAIRKSTTYTSGFAPRSWSKPDKQEFGKM